MTDYPPMPRPCVIPLAPIHHAQVATLHRLALPNGFLSRLGDSTLGTLYGAICQAPGSTVLVALDESERVIGFVSGTVNVKRCFRYVVRNTGLRLARLLIVDALRPSVIKRMLETLSYPFRGLIPSTNATEGLQMHREAELLSIAVAASARGHGLGQILLGELETFFESVGFRDPYVVATDAEDTNSNAFYQRSGFTLLGGFHHHGHPMILYKKIPMPRTEQGASTA